MLGDTRVDLSLSIDQDLIEASYILHKYNYGVKLEEVRSMLESGDFDMDDFPIGYEVVFWGWIVQTKDGTIKTAADLWPPLKIVVTGWDVELLGAPYYKAIIKRVSR